MSQLILQLTPKSNLDSPVPLIFQEKIHTLSGFNLKLYVRQRRRTRLYARYIATSCLHENCTPIYEIHAALDGCPTAHDGVNFRPDKDAEHVEAYMKHDGNGIITM